MTVIQTKQIKCPYRLKELIEKTPTKITLIVDYFRSVFFFVVASVYITCELF